jgi:hypothetical protein
MSTTAAMLWAVTLTARSGLARSASCAPATAWRALTGARPGGKVPSGWLAYTSFGTSDAEPLRQLASSLHRHEPDAWLYAVDDCSARNVRPLERDDRFQLLRRWRPSSYPTGLTGLLLGAFRYALTHYDFNVLLKIDTDAMLLRPGVFEAAERAFAADGRLGMAGSYLADTRGESERHRYAWLVPILEAEAKRDRVFGEALAAAKANGYADGEHVQGGVYVVSRAALTAIDERGYLRWRPRRRVLLYDDMVMSIFVRAAGFSLGELTDPHPTIRSAPNSLPLTLEEIAAERPAAVHTLKRGLDGEGQDEVRAFLTGLDA